MRTQPPPTVEPSAKQTPAPSPGARPVTLPAAGHFASPEKPHEIAKPDHGDTASDRTRRRSTRSWKG
jgi:hypothetical protein